MAYVYGISNESERKAEPVVLRKIGIEDVFGALQQGLTDFMEKPSHYVFLCVIYPIMGVVIGVWTSGNNVLPLLFPLVAGFALVGPIAAIGLYEISRRRETGVDASWTHAFEVLKSPSIGAIALVAALLAVLFLGWLAAAHTIYLRLYGSAIQEAFWPFVGDVLTTVRGLKLILLGNLVGLIFALVVLSISVVSFPMLLERKVGALVAVETSVQAMALNRGPVLLWGLIVAVLLVLGSLPLFAGLAVVLPILGHATWHFYRRLVEPPAELGRQALVN